MRKKYEMSERRILSDLKQSNRKLRIQILKLRDMGYNPNRVATELGLTRQFICQILFVLEEKMKVRTEKQYRQLLEKYNLSEE